MFRHSIVALSLTCLALLAAPALADHHEAGKAGGVEKAGTAATAAGLTEDDVRRLTSRQIGKAPEQFKVEFDTTKGKVVLEVNRAWSPNGVDRFHHLVKIGYFEDIAFFRVIQGFMAQFGIHGEPKVSRVWSKRTIPDDPVKESNLRGYVTFAKTGRPNSRTTQLFINLADNARLDRQGFSPFAKVVEGMDVVEAIYAIGEGAPRGQGPRQGRVQNMGNAYLKKDFPDLDYLKSARILE